MNCEIQRDQNNLEHEMKNYIIDNQSKVQIFDIDQVMTFFTMDDKKERNTMQSKNQANLYVFIDRLRRMKCTELIVIVDRSNARLYNNS